MNDRNDLVGCVDALESIVKDLHERVCQLEHPYSRFGGDTELCSICNSIVSRDSMTSVTAGLACRVCFQFGNPEIKLKPTHPGGPAVHD